MTQATILVADQKAEHLREIAHIFKSAGYIPLTVSSAKDALESIARFNPNLLFINPEMPDLETFTAKARQSAVVTIPPIVLAVSAKMSARQKQQYLTKFGASAIVSAPFTQETVVLAVQNLVDTGRQPLIQDVPPSGFFNDTDDTLREAQHFTSFSDPEEFPGLTDFLDDAPSSQDLMDLSDQFEIPTKPVGESKMFTATPNESEDLHPSSTVRVSAEEVQRQMEQIRENLAQGPTKGKMPQLPELPDLGQENKPRLRFTSTSENKATGFESGALTSSDIFGALISDIESGKVTQTDVVPDASADLADSNSEEKVDKPTPEPLPAPKPQGPFATQPIPEEAAHIPKPNPQVISEPKEEPKAETLPTGNQYQLLAKIASGGMAEVWKGKLIGEKGFEKIVAIKKILPHLSDNEEFITMFIDEAKVAANLTHPNIAQIYELGKMGDSFFIAMEYVGGFNLREILNLCKGMDVRFAPEIAVFIGMKLCNALNYAHLKKGYDNQPLNIVHRDVSPQNILISNEGEVKLVDFGIAKASIKASQTVAGSLKGKLLYMSPEQADGKAIDARSDTFSLASVIYEALTGKKLFSGDSELSVLKNVRQAKFVAPRDVNPDIPQFLADILLKTLSKDPDERFESAKELEKAFKAYLKQEKLHLTESDIADYLKLIIDKNATKLRDYGKQRSKSATPPTPQQIPRAIQPSATQATPGIALSAKKKKSTWPIWAAAIAVVLGAGGWWAFTKFFG